MQIMKRTLLLALTSLAALLATSCQKDDLGRILTATIEQYESNDKSATKAYINADNYACWEAGDLVNINGTQCTVSFEEGTQGAANSAKIDGTSLPTDQALMAFYPADRIDGTTVSFPQVQNYRENNGHQLIDNPMAAYCPADGTELRFRNLAALLKVTITAPSTQDLSLNTILVKGDDDQMLWGRSQLTLDYQNKPMLSKVTEGGTNVCLSFENHPVVISAGNSKSFYIVVPAGSDFFNFTIHVVTSQKVIYKKESKINQTLPRNHIGALTYTPADDDAVVGPAIFYTGNIAGFNSNAFGGAQVLFSEGGLLLFDRAVTTIGENAFPYCKGLTSITLPERVTTIGNYAFSYCSGLTSISLPSTLTTIGDYAFFDCSGLTSITLPEGVTTIGDDAFSSCSGLTSITLPATLTTIGDYAFYGCSSLARVNCYAQNSPSLGFFVFQDIPSKAVLHIPNGSIYPVKWVSCFGGGVYHDL